MDCTKEQCKGDNRKANCQCYALEGTADTSKKQVCAREENGAFYQCEAGCCNQGRGCPGQCSGVNDAPAYRVIPENSFASDEVIVHEKYRDLVIITAGAIIAINILLLINDALRSDSAPNFFTKFFSRIIPGLKKSVNK